MRYRLLRQRSDEQLFHVLHLQHAGRWDLRQGRPVTPPAEPVQAIVTGTYPSDFLENWFVVSNAMRKALTRADVDNVQYFPAVLELPHSDVRFEDYWLANVIGLVGCVDRERSTFEPREGRPGGDLRNFEIDTSESRGLSMFRLAEDSRVVVISERVQAVPESAGLRGLVFQDTATYAGGPVLE